MDNALICPHCQKEFIPSVNIYDDGYLYADPDGFVVKIEGKRIKLTATEHRFLACLIANADRVVTHRQLLLSLWGFEYQNDVDFVRIYVCSLRKKLEPDPSNPRYIITESGLGYYFNKEQLLNKAVNLDSLSLCDPDDPRYHNEENI